MSMHRTDLAVAADLRPKVVINLSLLNLLL